VTAISRWDGTAFRDLDYCDMTEGSVLVADSWRVENGRTLAVNLHRARLAAGAERQGHPLPDRLWDAAIARIPQEGHWFPRIDLLENQGGARWVLRMRPAPERAASAILATASADPRTEPATKGPDLAALTALRTSVQTRGATEAVILSPDGHIVDGTTSAVLWWDADALCLPDPTLLRTDSVTAAVVQTLATAVGIDVLHERRTPAELDQHEIWTVSALHGIRIVTAWIDGPAPAQVPGRLRLWRHRLDALTRTI
jgi:branched-subunit amino acid aminotransferase/4-amino-4-deoxychorismate lyase